MNPFHRSQVTDELLSAYIDGDVTAEEKKLVERAVQSDANVAWRLESLQQTVNLLRTLPEVSLPRSFVLTEADVAPVKPPVPPVVSAARRTARPRMDEPEAGGFWRSFKEFLQGGSPALRNMAAAGLAVWLLLFGATVLNPSRLILPASTQVEGLASVESSTEQEITEPVREVAIAQAESNDSTQADNAIQEENPVESAMAQSDLPELPAEQPDTNHLDTNQPDTNQSAPPAAENSATSAKSVPAASEPVASVNTEAAGQAVAAPAPQALRMGSAANDTTGTGVDPLAQAMGDTGRDGDLGGEISAANVESASTAMSDTIETNATFGDATTVTAEPENAQAYAAEAQAAVADAPAQESVTAAPVSQEQPTVEVAIASDQPAAKVGTIVEEQPASETVASQDSVEVAPTAEIALAQPAVSSSQPGQNQRVAPQVAEAVPTPIFDPIRMQLAQVTVALVTAVLALFWLASQRRRNKR